jgi:hypothetical protein
MVTPIVLITATNDLKARVFLGNFYTKEDIGFFGLGSVVSYLNPSETVTLPYNDALGKSLDSGSLKGLLDEGLLTVEVKGFDASVIPYTNVGEGLTNSNLQEAVDLIFTSGGGGGGGGVTDASELTFDPANTTLTETNTQDAVDEFHAQVFNVIKQGLVSDFILQGTGTFPFDSGDRQRTTETWNNDHAGFWFGNDWSINGNGGSRPVDDSQNGQWFSSGPVNPGYTGGDVIFRVVYTLLGSGGVGDAAKFRLGYTPVTPGHDLKVHQGNDSLYEFEYTTVVDLETIEFDVLQAFDLTIPEADWEASAQFFLFSLERRINDVEDTFASPTGVSGEHRIYIHGVEILSNGWGFDPS